MNLNKVIFTAVVCAIFAVAAFAADNNDTTTHNPQISCEHYNSSCDACLAYANDCYYCESKKQCLPLPTSMPFGLPFDGTCPMGDVKYHTCAVSLMLLSVSMLSVGGFLLLVTTCCCVYCCCCRGSSSRQSRKERREEEQMTREEEERQIRHAERRAERETKYDEIRAKYGLTRESSRPVDGQSSSARYQPMGDDN